MDLSTILHTRHCKSSFSLRPFTYDNFCHLHHCLLGILLLLSVWGAVVVHCLYSQINRLTVVAGKMLSCEKIPEFVDEDHRQVVIRIRNTAHKLGSIILFWSPSSLLSSSSSSSLYHHHHHHHHHHLVLLLLQHLVFSLMNYISISFLVWHCGNFDNCIVCCCPPLVVFSQFWMRLMWETTTNKRHIYSRNQQQAFAFWKWPPDEWNVSHTIFGNYYNCCCMGDYSSNYNRIICIIPLCCWRVVAVAVAVAVAAAAAAAAATLSSCSIFVMKITS